MMTPYTLIALGAGGLLTAAMLLRRRRRVPRARGRGLDHRSPEQVERLRRVGL